MTEPTPTEIRRGNPAPYLKTLRKMKKADWEALTAHCISALVCKETTVLLRFSHLVKFPEGFPQGSRIEKIGRDDIWEVGTKNMLRWLMKNGYTSLTMYQLAQQQRLLTNMCNKFDSMFEDDYNDVVENCVEDFLGEDDNGL